MSALFYVLENDNKQTPYLLHDQESPPVKERSILKKCQNVLLCPVFYFIKTLLETIILLGYNVRQCVVYR